MGAANIVQKSISDTSQSFWSKVGDKLPSIPLQTSSYDRGFVDFCMLVGLYTTFKLTVYGATRLTKALSHKKALNRTAFLQRYGEGSWAVIADVANNEQYCLHLAKQGLNLILMGQLADIQIIRQMIQVQGTETRTITYPVDWKRRDFSFEQFIKDIKDYDISFLVLPRFELPTNKSTFGTHVEQIPPYQHYYLLVRHVGPLIQWRSYQGAIIFPSSKQVNKLVTGHGVTYGVLSGIDSLMRTLNFELRNCIDVITARGTVEQCFIDLGKKSISE